MARGWQSAEQKMNDSLIESIKIGLIRKKMLPEKLWTMVGVGSTAYHNRINGSRTSKMTLNEFRGYVNALEFSDEEIIRAVRKK